MKLILIDLTNDKPSEIGSFIITQQEMDNNFYFLDAVNQQIANLLNISSSIIEILDLEDQDPLSLFKQFGEFYITIKNTNNKYALIPA